jgi:hypothetical protein
MCAAPFSIHGGQGYGITWTHRQRDPSARGVEEGEAMYEFHTQVTYYRLAEHESIDLRCLKGPALILCRL